MSETEQIEEFVGSYSYQMKQDQNGTRYFGFFDYKGSCYTFEYYNIEVESLMSMLKLDYEAGKLTVHQP